MGQPLVKWFTTHLNQQVLASFSEGLIHKSLPQMASHLHFKARIHGASWHTRDDDSALQDSNPHHPKETLQAMVARPHSDDE